jgi:hypothetical protein
MLAEELDRAASAAAGFAEDGEEVAAVLAAEPAPGMRVYVCAYERGPERAWLVLDGAGAPVTGRAAVREAVSIAALCELAEEAAGGGDLQDLRAQLVALRLREDPPGIEEAEQAALELERVVGAGARVASPGYLDEVGGATRRLERALGEEGPSPFAAAMQAAISAVESLTLEVEQRYKRPLE